MKQPEYISHTGVVTDIGGSELKVSILQASACAKCGVKSACGLSESEEKIINIQTVNPADYQKGETVSVYFKQSLGFRALYLGYVQPFLILLIALFVLMSLTGNEVLSGAVALALMVPYFLILYFLKDKIKKTFAFSVKKITV